MKANAPEVEILRCLPVIDERGGNILLITRD
jgi:hypothetical protein